MHPQLTNAVRHCIRTLEKYVGEIELVSYGFCYEVIGDSSQIDHKEIEEALNMLSNKDEQTIKELYL